MVASLEQLACPFYGFRLELRRSLFKLHLIVPNLELNLYVGLGFEFLALRVNPTSPTKHREPN